MIEKRRVIKARFSWIDWELPESPHSVAIANVLNECLEANVNAGLNRECVEEEMDLALVHHEEADNPDTYRVLKQVLDEVFCDE